jgi:hypothetical protein
MARLPPPPVGWLADAIVCRSLSDFPSDIFLETRSTHRVSD